MFVAKSELLNKALRAKVKMKKDSLYDVICSNNGFTEALVIVFAFGDDGSHSRSAVGHRLIFAVELVKKRFTAIVRLMAILEQTSSLN